MGDKGESKPSRDGGFSDPSFVTVGDPYVQIKERDRGIGGGQKPFLTCPPKMGQVASTFGPGFRKFEGLPGEYNESYKLEAKRRLENTTKYIKPNGFVFSSPSKKHTGSGDYYGAFSKFESSEEEKKEEEPKSNPKEKVFEKRNILTSPCKRGTFGYAGTLIGGQNIPAFPAEYDSQRVQAKKDDEYHRTKLGERKPFKPAGDSVDYFDSHEHVAASKVLGWNDECVAKAPNQLELMNPKERAAAKASNFKPWKPSNPQRDGEQGAFEKFPERQPDPYDEAIVNRAMLPIRRNPVKVAMKDLPTSLRERKAFKPSSGPKSKLTKGTCLLGISKHHL